MAEVTGQIGNEYVELDNAATEATLQELLKVMAALAKAAKVDVKDVQKEIDSLYKSSKKLNPQLLKKTAIERKANRENKKKNLSALAESEEEYANAQEDTTKQFKSTNAALDFFENGIKGSVIGLFSFADKLAGMGDSLPAAAQALGAIPIVGSVLSGVFGAVAGSGERVFSAFQTAAASGATFGGSIRTMVNAAGSAGLTFDQFSGIISRNSEGLALLGRGTEDGAKKFADMSKHLKSAMTEDGLAGLGFTTESANEAMARYSGRLARTGVAQTMDAKELSAASVGYLKNLDALSKLTGKSKDSLQAEQDAMMNQAKFRALLQGKDQETQDQLNRLLLSVPEGMRAGAMEVLATGTATSEAGRNYLAFMNESGQSFVQTGQMVRDGGKLTEQATDAMIDATRDEAKNLVESSLGQTLAMFDDGLNDFMVDAFDLAARTVGAEETRKATAAAAKNTDDLANSLVKAKQDLANFSNEITIALAEMMPHLQTVLGFVVDFVKGPLISTLGFLNNHFGKLAIVVGVLLTAILAAKAALAANQLANAVRGRGRGSRGRGGRAGGAARAGGGAMAGLGKAAAGVARFAGPIAVIAAAGTAIHGASTGVGRAAENFNLAEGQVATMGQKIASGFGGAIESLSFGLISGGAVARGAHIVGEAYTNGFNTIKDGVVRLWQNPEEVMQNLGNSIAAGFGRANEFVTGMWKGMTESRLGEAIGTGFNSARDRVLEWGSSIAHGYENLRNQAQGLVASAVTKAQELTPKVQEALTKTADAAKDAVASGWNRVSSFFARSPAEVVNAVKDQPVVATAEALPTGTSSPTAGGGQNGVETLVSNLNNRLDRLIALNAEIIAISQQQLTVQKGLTNDLYASV